MKGYAETYSFNTSLGIYDAATLAFMPAERCHVLKKPEMSGSLSNLSKQIAEVRNPSFKNSKWSTCAVANTSLPATEKSCPKRALH